MYVVDFTKGCAILENGKERPIYLESEGAWFRLGLRKVFLTARNCRVKGCDLEIEKFNQRNEDIDAEFTNLIKEMKF